MAAFIENETAYEAAVKRNIINNAKKTFIKNNPEVAAVFEQLYGNALRGCPFTDSLLDAYDNYGKLTEKQCNALLAYVEKQKVREVEFAAKREAEKGNSAFIGEIGQRVELTLTVLAVIALDTYYGTLFINILKDEAGNKVVYKGNGFLETKKGVIKVKATVKAHDVREGEKQTIIARPKVLEVLAEGVREFDND